MLYAGNKMGAIIFNRLYTTFSSWLYYHLQVIVVILRYFHWC
jgi:hypothetical protein